MKFQHYLITRFNVPIEQWNRDKKGLVTLDEAWMSHRLELFRRFCVPTIAGQTEKNFKWIIYCDKQTDSFALDQIHKAIQEIQNASIWFATDFNQLLNDLKLLILNADTSFVITSRVDNDDGLGANFIKEVQRHFVEKDNTIINLNGGILYDEEKRILTEIRDKKYNHYGSLVEEIKPADNLVSVLGYPHDKPPSHYHVINVDCRFSWLKIIHSRNLSSRTHGVPISLNMVLPHYTLDKTDMPISQVNTWKYAGTKLMDRIQKIIRK